MSDINKVLGQLLQGGLGSSFAGGLAGGLAGSMLSGKTGRKLGKQALGMGGIAAVAALAYTAYKRYSAGQGGASLYPVGATDPSALLPEMRGTAFLPRETETQTQDALGLTLVRAMIAAARSDGRFDSRESQVVFSRIQSLALGPEDKGLLLEEMNRPADMDAIVGAASNLETASEIYAASLLAIEQDDPAESAYLAMLAARLKLPSQLVAELHKETSAQPAAT